MWQAIEQQASKHLSLTLLPCFSFLPWNVSHLFDGVEVATSLFMNIFHDRCYVASSSDESWETLTACIKDEECPYCRTDNRCPSNWHGRHLVLACPTIPPVSFQSRRRKDNILSFSFSFSDGHLSLFWIVSSTHGQRKRWTFLKGQVINHLWKFLSAYRSSYQGIKSGRDDGLTPPNPSFLM